MDILDNKSPQMVSFFTALDELSATIQQALQNRTPQWRTVPYKTRGLPILAYLFPYSPKLERNGENSVYQITREDSVSRIRRVEDVK